MSSPSPLPPTEGTRQPTEAVLIAEYQCSQQSAEHQDTLAWQITAIIWGAQALMVASLVQSAQRPETVLLERLTAGLGIVLNIALAVLRQVNSWVMRQKYQRCWEIEEQLGMEQHLRMRRTYPNGLQRTASWFVTAPFIALWIWLVLRAH